MLEEIRHRINGLALLAEQMHKLDSRFGQEPTKGFIESLVIDLKQIAIDIDGAE